MPRQFFVVSFRRGSCRGVAQSVGDRLAIAVDKLGESRTMRAECSRCNP